MSSWVHISGAILCNAKRRKRNKQRIKGKNRKAN